ncbi:Bipolar DNA helicase [Methanosarcina horonobensis HB-1 = JCM 15518]|uniref:Bipolar DNA helicase n=1 Tax=Methanosarcina horonobensis HB-1 = JCM 15518 TaxID=1434110 RepID=A0A0E3WWW1_9EURY|nr:ATP-binding protein [Methanosarcina horonobensis]AKB80400.1 Bipolar DNA helicase [Methanosarcina horonobensis HB-1 = JCM 15518]
MSERENKDFRPAFGRKFNVTLRVLGNEENAGEGLLFLGNYMALDHSRGAAVYLDALKPHAILICGKRGYGKSYTMGCILEELAFLPEPIKGNLGSLIIDTMGIFWTMRNPNISEAVRLKNWELTPSGLGIEVFVPAGKVDAYEKRNIGVKPFSISIRELSGSQWCRTLRIEEVSPLGILLVRTIESLREKGDPYSFEDVINEIFLDSRSDSASKGAAENYFRAVKSWGLFSKEGTSISELITGGRTTVLDVSTLENENVCAAAVSILAGRLYEERLEARRIYEKKQMGEKLEDKEFPLVWLFIDEAHIFLPAGRESLASEVLINRCLRQGRQPGLSLVLATQRPASLHPDVVSQSDLLICHRLTSSDDILALETSRPLYMQENLRAYLKKMGSERGAALIVDDHSESVHMVRIRPRRSWHGGGEPNALGPCKEGREETKTQVPEQFT